jgi:hypothetical protein
MALICPQCGTDNPAGNAFCVSCGSALTATSLGDEVTQTIQTGPFPDPGTPPIAPPLAVAPGTALPPLSFLPAGYTPPAGYAPPSGPYLPAPRSGTAPAHRTSSTMLIAIVAAVLLVVGGGGVAYAALHKGGTTPAPNPNIPVTVPTTAPTTAPTAAPTQPPVTTPPVTSASGKIVSTDFAKVFVPTGFTVVDQESDSLVMSPSSGDEDATGVQAEPLDGATTDAQLDQALLVGDQQNDDPSAKMCSTKAPSQTQLVGSGGPITADVITICENLTPPNGPAFAAVDGYFAGVAKAGDGSFKAVWFEFLAPATSFQAFINSIPPAYISQTVFSDASPPS